MRMFQDPIAPEWATYTNDGRMDKFKIHKRLSDAKLAMTLHGSQTRADRGCSLYHWENNRWDLQEVRGGEDFNAPFHLGGKNFLGNTHPVRFCENDVVCAIHKRAIKIPEGFSFNWRTDTAVLEIVCTHGIGHPDPNQYSFWKANEMMYKSVHGCDSCCHLAQ